MQTTQTGFSGAQQTLAKLAKALGHPARIAILDILRQRTSCVCGDIVDQLPLAQATVSQHLKVLKEVGIIQGDISANKTCYCIDPKGWQQAETLLHTFFQSYAVREDCC